MARKVLARRSVVLVAVFFWGCAPALVPMDERELARLKNGPEIGAVHHEPAAFLVDVGVYGLIGYAMMAGTGKDIRERYRIEDPTPVVKAKFLDSLKSRSGFSTDQYVGYSVRGRLIRSEDSKVLWHGLCQFETPDIKRADLNADDGALLKAKLREAGEVCAADLWGQFQGRQPGSK